MMFTTLQQLCDRTDSQSGAGVLLAVSLTLQETDGVFEPSLGGDLSDHLNSVITDAYAAAGELPRISVSRHGNYQVCLQQHPALCQLEQEVMQHLTQVKKEAEHLRAGLNRYSHLWESDKMTAMEEFLTYGRQLGPEELEADVTPPTIKDYRREMEVLHTLSTEVTHLDDVITLNSWLQVDLRPFRESLLSIIYDWKHLYTEQLLTSLTDSLQQVRHRGNDDDDEEAAAAVSSPLRFPLTETVVLLESAGVTLPEHLSAQLQEVMSL
ncbi:dynein heavy chain 17%2C axonemal-like [Xyrichtys novacula]|nr:dynein heavy chain 17%2C axonemal-like [Xyrichtys novacula]